MKPKTLIEIFHLTDGTLALFFDEQFCSREIAANFDTQAWFLEEMRDARLKSNQVELVERWQTYMNFEPNKANLADYRESFTMGRQPVLLKEV